MSSACKAGTAGYFTVHLEPLVSSPSVAHKIFRDLHTRIWSSLLSLSLSFLLFFQSSSIFLYCLSVAGTDIVTRSRTHKLTRRVDSEPNPSGLEKVLTLTPLGPSSQSYVSHLKVWPVASNNPRLIPSSQGACLPDPACVRNTPVRTSFLSCLRKYGTSTLAMWRYVKPRGPTRPG